jgi:nicotinamide-nucleotide amidase
MTPQYKLQQQQQQQHTASAATVGRLLREKGLTLAVAESCTGGLLGAELTSVPGASAYFLGGVIAYDDAVKTALLGVAPSVIRRHGAVSAECALQMCRGVRAALRADVAVAITGIAGPTGGTADKPVGTTYIAVAGAEVEHVERFCWQGDREHNRRCSVETALHMLADMLGGASAEVELVPAAVSVNAPAATGTSLTHSTVEGEATPGT